MPEETPHAEPDLPPLTPDEQAEFEKLLAEPSGFIYDKRILYETLQRERAREAARRGIAAEDAAAAVEHLPDFRKLRTSVELRKPSSRPTSVISNSITGAIMRAGHTARLLADYKAGKTSVSLEFARASLTGELFLGWFDVVPVAPDEKVGWIDPELGDDWAEYVDIAFRGCSDALIDRLVRVDVQGHGVDMLQPQFCTYLAEQLEGCARVIVDSVSDMFSGDPNDARDVKTLFDNWDKIKKQAGIREALWVVHMNRMKEERSFGSVKWDARFQSMWTMLKDGDEVDASRWFRVDPGRHTAFPEARIMLTPEKRPVLDLTAMGKTRKEVRAEESAKKAEPAKLAKTRMAILETVRDWGLRPDAGGPTPSKSRLAVVMQHEGKGVADMETNKAKLLKMIDVLKAEKLLEGKAEKRHRSKEAEYVGLTDLARELVGEEEVR